MDPAVASLIAENTFTDWKRPYRDASLLRSEGSLDIIISGTWAGTITVQKRHVHSGTPTDTFDVSTFTANTANDYIRDNSPTVEYRIGFKTGGYTSGTAEVRLEP